MSSYTTIYDVNNDAHVDNEYFNPKSTWTSYLVEHVSISLLVLILLLIGVIIGIIILFLSLNKL
jgi:hypothetical protein